MLCQPLVSVIIPVYNGEKFLASCLQMMLRQTCKEIEIIVIDDGSTDQTANIAATFPIQLIQFEKNKGLSVARNVGMDAARGQYIHFMDVDDKINDCFYEELYKAAAAAGAEVACAGMHYEKRYYKSIFYTRCEEYADTYGKLKVTYVGKYGYVWRYLFDVQFLKKHHLRFEEGRLIEDLLFTLPALYFANKLVVVPRALYVYIYNQESLSSIRSKVHKAKLTADWLYASNCNRAFAREHNFKIPGVNAGVITFEMQKIYRKLGYKLFGKRFIKGQCLL